MAHSVEGDGASDSPLVDSSGRIYTPEEIEAYKRAERERTEKHYQQLLAGAEMRQARAQVIQAKASWVIAGLTASLVIMSVAGAFVSYLQFIAAKQSAATAEKAANIASETLRHMKENAITTADENRKALDRTLKQGRDALDVSVSNSRVDRRPWIGLSDARSLQFEKDKAIDIEFRKFNSGRSPAIMVREGTKYAISNALVPGPTPVWGRDFLAFQRKPAASIAPQSHGVFHASIPQSVVTQYYDKLKAGQMLLYVYGEITYSDTAGTIKGLTQFCFYMWPTEQSNLRYCEDFNNLR